MASNSYSNIVPQTNFNLGNPSLYGNFGMPKTNPLSTAINNITSGIKPSYTPVPQTPLKSTTVNNLDGSSVKHEYHAPGDQSSGITADQVKQNMAKYNSGLLRPDQTSAFQTGGNPAASQNLVGTNPQQGAINTNNYPSNTSSINPTNQSPAMNGTPQYAPATPYLPTDQSPEAVAYRAANPQNNYATAVQNMANVSQNNPAFSKANQDLLNYKQAVLDKQGAIDSTGADLAFKQGEQQTLQRTSQEGLLARQQAVQNAIQEQGLQQSGAQSVVSANAPLLGQYGQANYNPLSPQDNSGGGALNPLNNISNIAQQVLNGQISPSSAKAMGGNVSNFNGALNAELYKQSGGKYNEATQQAAYDSKQSNATAAGTASTNANVAGYSPALQSYNDINLKLNNVNDLGNLAVNTGTLGGINPFDTKYANMTVSEFRNQLSSEAQKRFDSSVSSFGSAASALIAASTGGTPTDITGIKNGLVDADISMGALKGLVDQAKKEGAIQAGNRASQVVDYKQSINGGAAPHLPGTMNSGGITYVLGTDGTYNPLK